MILSLQKPDLASVIESEGITLRQRGRTLWACCPLHGERTPSFKIDPERQQFYCFGCNNGGDVISFIQKYRGLSFKDALRYLGIEQGPLSRERKAEIELGRRKKAAVREFRAWVNERHRELSMKYRCLMRAKELAKSEEEYRRNPYACMEKLWEHYLDVLEEGSDKEKYELYQLDKQTREATDLSHMEVEA
ncbi:MAG: hypothetical protein K8I29_14420 [Alphaproteobacteria bacterium]|uniref:Zinc finger CHC2-type domain-containing protein n=1 Tax=Candidatus Nitrobium versatile TaxID=2884831 RepID=A0A953JET9_9BACT|nr:hypothetical protein [Candidatus Nitrobium versatile]